MTTTLTLEYLKAVTDQFDVATVFKLLLQKKMIRRLDKSLSLCINIRFLDLSYNDITRIENLDKLQFLEYMDLSHNKI